MTSVLDEQTEAAFVSPATAPRGRWRSVWTELLDPARRPRLFALQARWFREHPCTETHERELIAYAVLGAHNPGEIARREGLSKNTVKTHLRRVLRRRGAASMRELGADVLRDLLAYALAERVADDFRGASGR